MSELLFRTAAGLEARGYDVVQLDGESGVPLEAHRPEEEIMIEFDEGLFLLDRLRYRDEFHIWKDEFPTLPAALQEIHNRMLSIETHPGGRDVDVSPTRDGYVELSIENARALAHPNEARELINRIENAITSAESDA